MVDPEDMRPWMAEAEAEAARMQAASPMWRAMALWGQAVAAGRLPAGMEGSMECDYETDQIVLYVTHDSPDLTAQLVQVLGDDGWRTREVGGTEPDEEDPQQFVGAYYATAGLEGDLPAWFAFVDELGVQVEKSGTGVAEGPVDDKDEQAIYAYGPDADALLAVMEPHCRRFPVRPARLEIRYGGADDESAVEREIVLP